MLRVNRQQISADQVPVGDDALKPYATDGLEPDSSSLRRIRHTALASIR